MDTNVAVLYQKYLAYMADVRRWVRGHAGRVSLVAASGARSHSTNSRTCGSWRDSIRELRERWLRRLTHGYEHEKDGNRRIAGRGPCTTTCRPPSEAGGLIKGRGG